MTAANVSHLPEPKPKKKPSVAAREAEADDGYVTVEQCGVTLQIPVGDKTPAAAVDAYIEGGPVSNWVALKAIVGEKQWQSLLDAGMTRGDVGELDTKIGELQGN